MTRASDRLVTLNTQNNILSSKGNILSSKGNQAIKFCQLKEYYTRNIFPRKSYSKCGEVNEVGSVV